MCERVWVVDHTRCRYQNFLTPTPVAFRSAVLALARAAAANTAHRSDQGATHRRVAAKFIRFGSSVCVASGMQISSPHPTGTMLVLLNAAAATTHVRPAEGSPRRLRLCRRRRRHASARQVAAGSARHKVLGGHRRPRRHHLRRWRRQHHGVVGRVGRHLAAAAPVGASRLPRASRRAGRHPRRAVGPPHGRGGRQSSPLARATTRSRGGVVRAPPPPSVTRPLPRPTRGARRPHMPTASPPRRLAWGRPFTRGGGRSLGRAIMAGVSPQWPVVGGPTRPTERATDPPARPAGPRGSLGESPRQGAVGLVYYSARTPHFPGRRAMGPSLTN